MRKRAEQVDQTRQRIVDATVERHTTVGPADTTISAIAERADVTRLTSIGTSRTSMRSTPLAPTDGRRNTPARIPLYRDIDAWPEVARKAAAEEEDAWADALVAGSGVRGHARRRLRAAAGHAVSFWTWRSLVVGQDLTVSEAADLASALLLASGGRGSYASE